MLHRLTFMFIDHNNKKTVSKSVIKVLFGVKIYKLLESWELDFPSHQVFLQFGETGRFHYANT